MIATNLTRHIALCMQTGAFIQLSLTLYGIFARTHVLVAELRDATETCHKVCTGIFDMLDAKIVCQITVTSKQN